MTDPRVTELAKIVAQLADGLQQIASYADSSAVYDSAVRLGTAARAIVADDPPPSGHPTAPDAHEAAETTTAATLSESLAELRKLYKPEWAALTLADLAAEQDDAPSPPSPGPDSANAEPVARAGEWWVNSLSWKAYQSEKECQAHTVAGEVLHLVPASRLADAEREAKQWRGAFDRSNDDIAQLRADLARVTQERDAKHAMLTMYNLGGFIDAEGIMRRALTAETALTALRARVDAGVKCYMDKGGSIWRSMEHARHQACTRGRFVKDEGAG